MADALSNLGGAVQGLLGMQSGNQGTAGLGFQALYPNLDNPVVSSQASGAGQLAGTGLSNQLGMLNQMQMAQPNVFGQQQDLTAQLQAMANGQGPNPAQAALAQATGQNVAQQNALMAGQRGAGANVGLMARQAAMQGSQIQQNAAGQAATMQAQQQIAAQQALQSQLAQQAGQQMTGMNQYNQAAQSEQQLLLNAIAEQNKQRVAMQSNLNSVGGSLAGNIAQMQGNIAGSLVNGAAGLGKLIFNSGAGDAAAGAAGSAASEAASQGAGDIAENILPIGYKGGQVRKFDSGGMVDSATTNAGGIGPQSFVGKFLSGGWGGANIGSSLGQEPQGTIQPPGRGGGGVAQSDIGTSIASGLSNYYTNKAMTAEEISNLNPMTKLGNYANQQVSNGQLDSELMNPPSVNLGYDPSNPGNGDQSRIPGSVIGFNPTPTGPIGGFGGFGGGGFYGGGVIRGESYANQMRPVPGKAKVSGDSLKNDNVKALLSPGEIVLPRHITMGPDAPEKAKRFVQAILAKNGPMRKKP